MMTSGAVLPWHTPDMLKLPPISQALQTIPSRPDLYKPQLADRMEGLLILQRCGAISVEFNREHKHCAMFPLLWGASESAV